MRPHMPLVVALTALVVLVTLGGCSSSKRAIAVVDIGPGTVKFRVEIAQTAEQQRGGLAGRPALPEGTGMLFRFGNRAEQQVWMAGMSIPLDIAWIVDDKVLAVDTLTPCTETDHNNCPRATSPAEVDAVLEVPAQSLATVVPGMSVSIEEQPS